MRYFASILTILLATTLATAQNPQFDPSRMRMMMGDPNAMFDRIAKGKEFITKADLEGMPGFAQTMFDRTISEMGITNGQLTREQYKQAVEQGMTRMRERGMGGSGPSADAINRFTEDRFRSLDKNGDGLLQNDEMPDALKAERDKWDANKDGFVDLSEYKTYSQARFADRSAERRGNASGSSGGADEAMAMVPQAIQEIPSEQRPVVFRAGKLPKELPSWFAQLDTDLDGQVGLYEWVKGGKSVSGFREMDLNDDSFLIAEEVLRVTKDGNKSSSFNLASAVGGFQSGVGGATPSTSNSTPNAGRQPSGDGRRGPGGGWGGWGGGRGRPGGERGRDR